MRNFFSRQPLTKETGPALQKEQAEDRSSLTQWRKGLILFGGCILLLMAARACNSHQESKTKAVQLNRQQELKDQTEADSQQQIALLKQQLEAKNQQEKARQDVEAKERESAALRSLNQGGLTPEQQRQLDAMASNVRQNSGVQQQAPRGYSGGSSGSYNASRNIERPVSLIVSYRSEEEAETRKRRDDQDRLKEQPKKEDMSSDAEQDREENREEKPEGTEDKEAGPKYQLRPGTLLPCTEQLRINGAFAGNVNCLISIPIYSASGNHLLIPQGSLALGKITKVESTNQERLFVAFQQIILPDGTTVQIKPDAQALDQVGQVGLKDKVDRHTARIFGTSLAIAAIGGLAQIGAGGNGGYYSPMDQYRAGVGASVSQSSMQILQRRLDTMPTFVIREGARNNLYLEHPLWLTDYSKHPYRGDQ
jgi:type IV secretory pathway VirB10-like protein